MSDVRAVDPSISKTPIPLNGEDLATICVLCSHNCGLRVDVEGGRITKIRADESNPITSGYMCNKAVTCDRYAHHAQRLQHPMRRREDGTFEEVSWDVAIGEIAAKMSQLRSEFGPRSLALVGIGGQGNHMDAAYATSFLSAVGTKRLFNAYAQEKTQHHLVDRWMMNCPPSVTLHADLENAKYLMVMGTNPRISNRGHNPTETFKSLAKKADCTVVVVDPRDTETTRGADRHLRVKPGRDAFFLIGLAAALVQHELYDAEFVAQGTSGYDQLRDVLGRVDIAEMASRCGLDRDAVVTEARAMSGADGGAIMYDLGVEQTPYSTLVSYLIRLNLALTGNLGREGGDIFMEGFLPPPPPDAHDHEPERALVSGIPGIKALGPFEMFSPSLVPEEILNDHPERIRGMIVEGSNPMLSFSDTKAWREAIDKLDILVVIEPAFTETARLADYVLPTPVGYEKWEIALFPKRSPQIDVQVRPPVIPGPEKALPEPEIYARLGEAMGVIAPLPDDLAEIGRPETPEARMAFLGTVLGKLGELTERGLNAESHLVFWGYRGIGHHFPAPSLVAIWAQCQANAMGRHEAVLRVLGEEWADRSPSDIAEELFRRILDHPEGVEIARLSMENNLTDHILYDDKKVRLLPPEIAAELDRAIADSGAEDGEYPFILGSGLRTRWTANTIQRDPGWRKGSGALCELHISAGDADALGLAPGQVARVETRQGSGALCELHISAGDADALGLAPGQVARVETRRGSLDLPVAVDRNLKMPGYMWMPNGFGMEYADSLEGETVLVGANCNEITDVADRDPFTGCPHHRLVRVKVSAAA